MMRVVFVGTWFRPEGDDSHLRALSRLVDLTLYGNVTPTATGVPEAPPPPNYCRTRVLSTRVFLERGVFLWSYRGLAAALTDDAPDVVHVVGEPWQLVPFQAGRWAARNPKTALAIQGADRNWSAVPSLLRAARRPLATRTLTRADAFVSESSGGLAEPTRLGLPTPSVTAVINTNPRSENEFHPPHDLSEREAVRAEFGLPKHGTGLLFLGRLSPEKGPTLFLDAIERVLAARPQTWAAIGGAGPQEEEIAPRAQALGVRMLGSVSYPDGVARLLRGIDVLVIPSVRYGRWEEQGPRAVIEGFLSGCAVVGTPVGALPEMLDGAGAVASTPEPGALAEAILNSTEPSRLDELQRLGRSKGVASYSGDATARALVSVWTRAIANRLSE